MSWRLCHGETFDVDAVIDNVVKPDRAYSGLRYIIVIIGGNNLCFTIIAFISRA